MSFQTSFIPRSLILRLLISAILGLLPVLGSATTYTVNSDQDNTIDDRSCTLREAIQKATNNAGDDCGKEPPTAENRIVFTHSMTIKRTHSNTLNVNNRLIIDAEQHGVTIDGDGKKIFYLADSDSDLSLFNMILTNAYSSGAGGAVHVDNPSAKFTATQVRFLKNKASSTGGAIESRGHLQLTNVQFEENESGSDGGAINAGRGDLFLTNVSFFKNIAQGNGGAMAIDSGTTSQQNVALVAVDFTGNTANGNSNFNQESGGGALWLKNGGYAGVRFLLMLNTFTDNTAPNGNGGAMLIANGTKIDFPDEMELQAFVEEDLPNLANYLGSGLFNPSTFNLKKSLDTGVLLAKGLYSMHFTGNTAGGDGGALYNRGTTSILSSSFELNVSQRGGAIANNATSGKVLTLANTTLVGNAATENGSAIANLAAGQVKLINDTVAHNLGINGIYNDDVGGQFSALNTLFAHNGVDNCVGSVIANQFNNIQYPNPNPNSGCGSALVIDPELFAVTVPGVGLLNVVMILPFYDDSPANGAGNPAICDAAPIFNADARGWPFTRPGLMEEGTSCDIGAYESMGGALIQSGGNDSVIDFGRVRLMRFLDKKATLINTSDRDLTIKVLIDGTHQMNIFSIIEDGCSGALPSGENCAVAVRFRPTGYNDYISSLKVFKQIGSGKYSFSVLIDEIPLTGSGPYGLPSLSP